MSLRKLVSAAVLVACASYGAAAEPDRSWRIGEGEILVLVPLKPGGAFEARTVSLTGEVALGESRPLALGGRIAAELGSIDTGISLRDQHLREKYLEVARGPGFDRAVLSEIVLKDADGAAFRGSTEFTGMLLLHGVTRAVEGTGEIRTAGSGVRVEARFSLTLTDFEIEPPAYLGVGVANKVAVRVSFEAQPTP